MAPSSWKPCPHCGQKFSSSSLAIHVKRCTQRAEVQAEHELRELEGFHRPTPVDDWEQCPNCGEKYGETALPPHVKRCKRLRPNGANGFGANDPNAADAAPGAGVFAGLWGVGDLEEMIRELRAAAGINGKSGVDAVLALFRKFDCDGNGTISEKEMMHVLKDLCPKFTTEQMEALFRAADADKNGSIDYNEFVSFLMGPGNEPTLSKADLDALRALFNRFDEDSDGMLEPSEFTTLMQNMLPTRANDFTVADVDGNGGIDFDEFVKYWTTVVGSPGFRAATLDEAADMFECFDRDGSGELSRREFLALLDNLFPTHCEENEEHVAAEFAAADGNDDDGISFAEFIAYYDRLQLLYGDPPGWPPRDANDRHESLKADLVRSECGLMFLPDRLAVHSRGCKTCKAAAAAARKKIADEEAAREAALNRAAEEAALAAATARAAKNARAQEEAEERARRAAEEAEKNRKAKEAAEKKRGPDANGLIPCQFCGRTFFPDRVSVHERACPKNTLSNSGIRPTVTPGEEKATIGRYRVP